MKTDGLFAHQVMNEWGPSLLEKIPKMLELLTKKLAETGNAKW